MRDISTWWRWPDTLVRVRRSLLAVLVLLCACSTVDSGDVRTSGIKATVLVTPGEEGSQVFVTLSSGGNTSIELRGEDKLFATYEGDSDELDPDTFLSMHTYSGHVAASKPGEEVVVSFERGSDDTDAPSSTVLLPGEVDIQSPEDGARVRRSRDLVLRLNHAPGTIRLTWHGPCLIEAGASLEFDEGQPLVVPARSFVHRPGTRRSCSAYLVVTRTVRGTLDEAFKNGSISAQRSTTVQVRLVP